MHNSPRIYLDNAATSWPKPESVYVAVERMMRQSGATYSRGSYSHSVEVTGMIEGLRDDLAKLIQAPHRRTISFAFSGTDALNVGILGLLRADDHVVTSVVEHNSVLRPIQQLKQTRSVDVSYVDCDSTGKIQVEAVLAAITPRTKLVALTHASNVTGTVQELAPIGKTCRQKGIPFLVDAAQTMGHLPVSVNELHCDLLACSGHKGLLGPLGTGFFYCSDALAERIEPLRFGGTGATRIVDELPRETPEKFEAGNLNVPGLAGLAAALEFRTSDQWHALHAAWLDRSNRLLTYLRKIKGVRLFGIDSPQPQRLPVFAIQVENRDSHEIAAILDSSWGIQTRAGYHCAPRLHRRLNTESTQGLVRISLGLFNTDQDVDQLLTSLELVAKS